MACVLTDRRSPPELEAVLLDHPGISDAGVIGVKKNKDDDSEFPRAYIVKKSNQEGQKLDGQAIISICHLDWRSSKDLTGVLSS